MHRLNCLPQLFFIVLLFTLVSCAPDTILSPTESTTTTSNQNMVNACTQVIDKFIQANPCKDWDEFHNLFSPESRHYQSTPMALNDLSCDLKTSSTVLQILPAEEWWEAENPNQVFPDSAKPTLSNEHVFFVKYEIQWQSGVTPPSKNPIRMLAWMVFDDDSETCLIRDFGW